MPQDGSRFVPATGADGKPFALALIGAMIAAANADGHIDSDARVAIDPDHPDERAVLTRLAHALNLPDGLAGHLDTEVAQNLES